MVVVIISYFNIDGYDQNNTTSTATSSKNAYKFTDLSIVKQAFEAGEGDLQVLLQGRVIKVLRDDTKGRKHQKFLVKLADNRVILIAHNIDLAPRVANIKSGTDIIFYGEYEWNSKGGVVHWTHHDPRNKHAHGWIKYQGQKYQ